jgi:hypothetical protein
MGPLFSIVFMALAGLALFAIVFCVFAFVWRERSIRSLAVFAVVEAASFLVGCALAALLQVPIWAGEVLASRSAVLAYLGISVATGGAAAALAGRTYWKLVGAR